MPCSVLFHSLYSLPSKELGCQDSVPPGLGILKLGPFLPQFPLLTLSLLPAPHASAEKDLASIQGATSLASLLLHAGQGLPPCLQWVLQVGPLAWGHPPTHTYTFLKSVGHLSGCWQVEELESRAPGLHVKCGPRLGPPASGHPATRKDSTTQRWARRSHKPCPSLGHLVLGRDPPLADATAHSLLVNPLTVVSFSLSPKSQRDTQVLGAFAEWRPTQ